ncbi:hypothetical protein [Solidesulfovibrio carbinolicus]|uniref:hypothetical protein n=1 Tax=Solidesulfovibrio carbinolicus TaxID=296842 RepID=UPI0010107DF3|nr:hypothetical protein [Solidesulfovibrio carbinolicus]
MKKLKFIPCSFAMSWNEFIATIMDAKYTDESSKGITISDVSKNKIQGIFYEKVVFSETLYNPIQGDYDVTRETFFRTEFLFFNKITCLISPSRRAPNFFSFLSKLTSFRFFISENKLNMPNLIDFLQASIHDFKVTKSTYKFFSINDNLKCSMSLASKDNVLNYTKDMGFKVPNIPNKFSFTGLWRNQETKGDISETGLVTISCCDYNTFIDLFVSNADLLFSIE